MAYKDSWPTIECWGLLSTTALLDRLEIAGTERAEIERRRRPQSVAIEHPDLGSAVIRDNKPLNEKLLMRSLDGGMTAEEWYLTLNARVFFWVKEKRLSTMLGAGAYKGDDHLVLEIDTAALLDRHLTSVTLTPTNTGATHPGNLVPRGRGTFRRFHEYDWDQRRDRTEPAVELAVDYAVPDIRDLVRSRTLRRVD